MSSLNKVLIIGNLGKDPVTRHTQAGKPITSFSVACSESWKDRASGERKEKTEWLNVVVFNENLCTLAQNYLKKGSKVYLEGKIATRKWTDNSGVEKYTTEVVLENFNGTLILLDKAEKIEPSGYESRPSGYSQPSSQASDLSDEIPF